MRHRFSSPSPMGVVGVVAAALILGCSGETAARRTDGLDPSAMPDGIRPDYQVFADRCSKCHSLSRPLNSGIDNDGYWATYVERMRRQPASGISHEDVPRILRFLHYYVVQQQEAKAKKNGAGDTASPPDTIAPSPGPIVNVVPGGTRTDGGI